MLFFTCKVIMVIKMHSNLIKFYDQLSVIIQQNPESSEIPLLESIARTSYSLNDYKKCPLNIAFHLEMLVDMSSYFIEHRHKLKGMDRLLFILENISLSLKKIEIVLKEVI